MDLSGRHPLTSQTVEGSRKFLTIWKFLPPGLAR